MSVGRSVCLSGKCTVAKRLSGVVSGVGRNMGVLDGDGDRRRGRGSFGSKCKDLVR